LTPVVTRVSKPTDLPLLPFPLFSSGIAAPPVVASQESFS
jgi:hypothetical protein